MKVTIRYENVSEYDAELIADISAALNRLADEFEDKGRSPTCDSVRIVRELATQRAESFTDDWHERWAR